MQGGARPARCAPRKTSTARVAALVIALRAALDSSHAEIEAVRDEAAHAGHGRRQARSPAPPWRRCPAGDVENALREAMHQAIGEPRITLRAAPDVVAALEGRVDRHRP